nr:Pep23 [Streptomyces sp. NAK02211]
MAYLVIIDRGYRGSAEAQFFDALYGVEMLGDQLGGMDVVLRGSSVTAALAGAGPPPALQVGPTAVNTLADPRRSVGALVDKGAAVYVDEPGLAALGLDDAPLLPGVTRIDTAHLAARWGDYAGVWFL